MSDARPRILCVDDEPVNLKLFDAFLIPQGYDVLHAHSGRQALEMIQEQKVDLVLLDVMMPEMNGYDVCRRIKEDQTHGNIPVIMITSLQVKKERIKGHRGRGRRFHFQAHRPGRGAGPHQNAAEDERIERSAGPGLCQRDQPGGVRRRNLQGVRSGGFCLDAQYRPPGQPDHPPDHRHRGQAADLYRQYPDRLGLELVLLRIAFQGIDAARVRTGRPEFPAAAREGRFGHRVCHPL